METVKLEHSEVTLFSHSEIICAGTFCTVHNRSNHHMRAWKQHWRSDIGIMERLCEHGVGHPDPDEMFTDGIHGCDGCCYDPR